MLLNFSSRMYNNNCCKLKTVGTYYENCNVGISLNRVLLFILMLCCQTVKVGLIGKKIMWINYAKKNLSLGNTNGIIRRVIWRN